MCSFSFVKKIISTKMAPEIWVEIPTMLSRQTRKNAHTTFCFLNFKNIIDFLVKTFHESVQNSLPFHISKKVNFAKWCIRLHCTDLTNYPNAYHWNRKCGMILFNRRQTFLLLPIILFCTHHCIVGIEITFSLKSAK